MSAADFVSYWNDETVERQKVWWVEGPDDRRLIDHLENSTNIARSFRAALDLAERQLGAVRGIVVDLGAGVCWTSAILSRYPHVQKVHAIDYSAHRLFKLAPIVFQQLEAVEEKIERQCGPMSALPFPDGTVDLVIFCQALYMAERPVEILSEVHRVLRARGVVVIACENIVDAADQGKRWRRRAAAWRIGVPRWRALLTGQLPDQSGRYPYGEADYARFLTAAGFAYVRHALDYPVFKDAALPAVNHFGIKAA